MILATRQCQHIFFCWVEPSLLLSSLFLFVMRLPSQSTIIRNFYFPTRPKTLFWIAMLALLTCSAIIIIHTNQRLRLKDKTSSSVRERTLRLGVQMARSESPQIVASFTSQIAKSSNPSNVKSSVKPTSVLQNILESLHSMLMRRLRVISWFSESTFFTSLIVKRKFTIWGLIADVIFDYVEIYLTF